MPAFDKTGPLGTGPLGRGRGGCQQADALSSPMRGMRGGWRGQGQGRGFGQGNGRGCCGGNRRGRAAFVQEDEATMLEARISAMQARLNELKSTKNAE